MSEPPEQEEEPDDPAAGADLEELLEQFREPEEPRRPRANPLWFVAAILMSVLGVWLALRASGGSAEEKPESAALAGAMLPGKTSERLPVDEGPVDVVEDYLARCKKGMTAQEVRWIVEDFQRAGLDDGPGSILSKTELLVNNPSRVIDGKINAAMAAQLRTASLECARLQREWYGNALADGLMLDPAQKRVLKERLGAALAKDQEQFENKVKAFAMFVEAAASGDSGLTQEIIGEIERLSDGEQVSYGFFEGSIYLRFLAARTWLEAEHYAPWNLCALTERQREIFFAGKSPEPLGQVAAGDGSDEDPQPWYELALAASGGPIGGDGGVSFDSVYPFTEDQKLSLKGGEPLELEQGVMHPSQLKVLLLLRPELAAQLSEKLDSLEK